MEYAQPLRFETLTARMDYVRRPALGNQNAVCPVTHGCVETNTKGSTVSRGSLEARYVEVGSD